MTRGKPIKFPGVTIGSGFQNDLITPPQPELVKEFESGLEASRQAEFDALDDLHLRIGCCIMDAEKK